MSKGNKWYIIHDLKAYLVYRKTKELAEDKNKLCEELAEDKSFKDYIGLNSIKMRFENYRYIDTGQGLKNYAQQSKEVFDDYKDKSIQEIKTKIQELEKLSA